VVPGHTAVFPEIAPGCAGNIAEVTVIVCAVLLPQVLLAFTEIMPPVDPAVAIIELVVDVPVHPAGKVHVYDVIPETVGTEYVWVVPAQAVVLPVIPEGCAGAVDVMVSAAVVSALLPQLLFALTERVPPVGPVVVVIVLPVDVPVHPDGKAQV